MNKGFLISNGAMVIAARRLIKQSKRCFSFFVYNKQFKLALKTKTKTYRLRVNTWYFVKRLFITIELLGSLFIHQSHLFCYKCINLPFFLLHAVKVDLHNLSNKLTNNFRKSIQIEEKNILFLFTPTCMHSKTNGRTI